jgi:hypothetical protein
LLWSFVYLAVRNLFALVWLLARPVGCVNSIVANLRANHEFLDIAGRPNTRRFAAGEGSTIRTVCLSVRRRVHQGSPTDQTAGTLSREQRPRLMRDHVDPRPGVSRSPGLHKPRQDRAVVPIADAVQKVGLDRIAALC